MTEDWETDFQNPPRILPPGCNHCGGKLPEPPVYVRYTVPGYVLEYEYCSDICRHDHKMRLMREAGF